MSFGIIFFFLVPHGFRVCCDAMQIESPSVFLFFFGERFLTGQFCSRREESEEVADFFLNFVKISVLVVQEVNAKEPTKIDQNLCRNQIIIGCFGLCVCFVCLYAVVFGLFFCCCFFSNDDLVIFISLRVGNA